MHGVHSFMLQKHETTTCRFRMIALVRQRMPEAISIIAQDRRASKQGVFVL
jgi:hypothetical protein